MNKKEIIKRLKENKTMCPRFSMIGEDNHNCIDNMVKILREDMTPWDADEFDIEAAVVLDVLSGDIPIEDILYPEE